MGAPDTATNQEGMIMAQRFSSLIVACALLTVAMERGADAAPKRASAEPTSGDVPYGEAPRQVLDLWKADSPTPTPLLFYIHGGSWNSLDKRRVDGIDIKKVLAAGISVVSIEYRFVTAAKQAGVEPPVKWPLEDAARALQFVRSKATEWNIDPTRIVVCGTSAGGCSSLWLAFHDDMADARSKDAVARQSTRPMAVVANEAQTSLDPAQMREWLPTITYGPHAFGISGFPQFLAARQRLLPWIMLYSPYHLASADDPPVYMFYSTPPTQPQDAKAAVHSAIFGTRLHARLTELGVKSYLQHPSSAEQRYPTLTDCVISVLNADR